MFFYSKYGGMTTMTALLLLSALEWMKLGWIKVSGAPETSGVSYLPCPGLWTANFKR